MENMSLVDMMTSKERDNTWLQLPICPSLWRQKDLDHLQDCQADQGCHSNYAHPPSNVLKQALSSGYVVCCQAFVFSAYAPDDGTVHRPKCKRGSDACKYFHPPKHLGLLVINAGRNNKRLRQEMASRMKLQAQAQVQALTASSPIAWQPFATTLTQSAPPVYYQVLQPQVPACNFIQSSNPSPSMTLAQPIPPGTGGATADIGSQMRKRPRSPDPGEGGQCQSPEAKRRSGCGGSTTSTLPGTLEYQQWLQSAMQQLVFLNSTAQQQQPFFGYRF